MISYHVCGWKEEGMWCILSVAQRTKTSACLYYIPLPTPPASSWKMNEGCVCVCDCCVHGFKVFSHSLNWHFSHFLNFHVHFSVTPILSLPPVIVVALIELFSSCRSTKFLWISGQITRGAHEEGKRCDSSDLTSNLLQHLQHTLSRLGSGRQRKGNVQSLLLQAW